MSGSIHLLSQSRVPLTMSWAPGPTTVKLREENNSPHPVKRPLSKSHFLSQVQLLPRMTDHGNIYSFRGNPTLHPQGCDLDLWPNWAITLEHNSPTAAHFSQRLSYSVFTCRSSVFTGRTSPKPVQYLCIIVSPGNSKDHACLCFPISFRSQYLFS